MDLFYVVELELFILDFVDFLVGVSGVIVLIQFGLFFLVKEVFIDVVKSSEFFFSSLVRSLNGEDFIFVESDGEFSIFEKVFFEMNIIYDILYEVYNKLNFSDQLFFFGQLGVLFFFENRIFN